MAVVVCLMMMCWWYATFCAWKRVGVAGFRCDMRHRSSIVRIWSRDARLLRAGGRSRCGESLSVTALHLQHLQLSLTQSGHHLAHIITSRLIKVPVSPLSRSESYSSGDIGICAPLHPWLVLPTTLRPRVSITMSLHMPEDAASVLEQFMHDGEISCHFQVAFEGVRC